MENSLVKIVADIRQNLSQRSSSQKDEVRVMQAMLNDKEFVVDVYGSTGVIGTYSPYEDSRKMVSSIIANTAKVSKDEAEFLAGEFEFSKNDAGTMVNVSKQFINSYLETGRKLPLGGRAESNVSLLQKEVDAHKTRVPNKSDGADGSKIIEKDIPAHKSIKVKGSCPDWLKK